MKPDDFFKGKYSYSAKDKYLIKRYFHKENVIAYSTMAFSNIFKIKIVIIKGSRNKFYAYANCESKTINIKNKSFPRTIQRMSNLYAKKIIEYEGKILCKDSYIKFCEQLFPEEL